jgi:hypothetical protein
VCESAPNGRRKFVAVEWVVPGPNTNPPGVTDLPSLFGMPMHILVPAVGFYLKHAWIWKPNPAGMFADFNPEVTWPLRGDWSETRKRTGRTDAVRPPGLELIAWESGCGARPARVLGRHVEHHGGDDDPEQCDDQGDEVGNGDEERNP